MLNLFDGPITEGVPTQECCKCTQDDIAIRVALPPQTYAFCRDCEYRGALLRRGKAAGWPALRIQGITGTYALDSDWEAWFLTAICGTDERVVELLDALDEWEASHAHSS